MQFTYPLLVISKQFGEEANRKYLDVALQKRVVRGGEPALPGFSIRERGENTGPQSSTKGLQTDTCMAKAQLCELAQAPPESFPLWRTLRDAVDFLKYEITQYPIQLALHRCLLPPPPSPGGHFPMSEAR